MRRVVLEDGREIKVEEDLCPVCRGQAFSSDEPSWNEYMTDEDYWSHLGLDVTEDREPSNTTKRRKV
jgi:hypothetical protein